jgi:hypothetical protein
MDTQDATDTCFKDRSYGIDLHSWKNFPNSDKVTIEDVTFYGYKNCPIAYPFHVDDDVSRIKSLSSCAFLHPDTLSINHHSYIFSLLDTNWPV